MFFKMLGGLLIILSSGLMGVLYANKLSFRYRELVNLRRAMQMLETEVVYGVTPLPVALSSVSNKTEGSIVSFFGNVSQSLSERSCYTVEEAWSDSADKLLLQSSMLKIDIELIKYFGNILGSSDREDQKKHFRLFYLQLAHHEDAAMEEIKKSAKMYGSLGFLLGIAVFIIMV